MFADSESQNTLVDGVLRPVERYDCVFADFESQNTLVDCVLRPVVLVCCCAFCIPRPVGL